MKQWTIVTGGAGFVGSHLCDYLTARGKRVACVDNLSTGRQANIAHLLGEPGFRFILHDVVEPLSFDEPVDEIYNLACPASPSKYVLDPIHTLKTSVYGAVNFLDLAVRKNAKILQASTSEIYGDPEVTPQTEKYLGNVNTFGPRSCYDEGKRAAETLFHDYHERHGLDVKVARIFNTYGPRMHPEDGRVISTFIRQALTGEPMTIFGDGTQKRAFCYVDDLVEGLARLMASPRDVFSPVNLGNPADFTIAELAELVSQATGASVGTVRLPLPQDDPRKRRPDISLAEKKLGWRPQVPLRTGLDSTIEHMRRELAEAPPLAMEAG